MPKPDLQLSGPQALAAQGDKADAAEMLLSRAHALAEALWHRLAHMPVNDLPAGTMNDLHTLATMLTEEIEEAQVLLEHLVERHAET
jgi:hypothetical protein